MGCTIWIVQFSRCRAIARRDQDWESIVKKFAVACLLIVATAIPALAASLVVINSSDYVIHQLYVSSADERNWGKDQLGKQIINRGERFTLRNIPDGNYDLKIVDEDEDECIIRNVRISGDMQWMLTDTIIENCVK